MTKQIKVPSVIDQIMHEMTCDEATAELIKSQMSASNTFRFGSCTKRGFKKRMNEAADELTSLYGYHWTDNGVIYSLEKKTANTFNAEVLALISLPIAKEAIRETYSSIKLPFTQKEVDDFLNWKPGATVLKKSRGGLLTRSDQVKQALSCVGANLADRNKLTKAQKATYKAVWAIERDAACPRCKQPVKHNLMYGLPQLHCHRPRCVFGAMHDHL